jgi:hypothetical protein
MNQIYISRLELAKENAKRFISNPNVKAIIVTGSVALGYADDNSDIDTIVMYKELIPEEEYNSIVENAKNSGGDLYGGTAREGFALYEYVKGIRCDFGHGYFEQTEKLISDMVNNPDTDETKQLLISGFVDCIPLYGEEWVNTWRLVASDYPDKLTDLILKEHLRFHPKWVLEKMVIDRNDTIYLYEILVQSIKDIICVLCALNKIYYNGKLKSTFYFIKRMNLKPANLQLRFEKILKNGDKDSVNELYELIEEVILIIEKNHPGYDTSRTRNVINMILRK